MDPLRAGERRNRAETGRADRGDLEHKVHRHVGHASHASVAPSLFGIYKRPT